MDSNAKKALLDEREHLFYVSTYSKKCPRCKLRIQKGEGCNSMTCKCGCRFCWLCEADLLKDPRHFSNGECK